MPQTISPDPNAPGGPRAGGGKEATPVQQSKTKKRERVTAGGGSGEVGMLALKGVCFRKLVVERVFRVSFLSSSANVPASTGAYHGFRAWTVILLGVLPQPLFREG